MEMGMDWEWDGNWNRNGMDWDEDWNRDGMGLKMEMWMRIGDGYMRLDDGMSWDGMGRGMEKGVGWDGIWK